MKWHHWCKLNSIRLVNSICIVQLCSRENITNLINPLSFMITNILPIFSIQSTLKFYDVFNYEWPYGELDICLVICFCLIVCSVYLQASHKEKRVWKQSYLFHIMSNLPNVIPSSLFYSTKENLQELAIASY